MNIVTFREPTKFYVGDASEHGLGGWSNHGRAWSFTIPEHLRGRAHINLLEFITTVICIWLDIEEKVVQDYDCLLAIGDSTSAMGWLRRTNFRGEDESNIDWMVKQRVGRKLANLVLGSKITLYSQWLKGTSNIVADSLSRDSYIFSQKTHQLFLSSMIPTKLPNNFRIRPLPEKISSFITSTLQQLPVKQQRYRTPKPSELLLGTSGRDSSSALSGQSPFTWKDWTGSNATLSCPHLRKQCKTAPTPEEMIALWRAQSTPPSHMWHRPSGQTEGRTPD